MLYQGNIILMQKIWKNLLIIMELPVMQQHRDSKIRQDSQREGCSRVKQGRGKEETAAETSSYMDGK